MRLVKYQDLDKEKRKTGQVFLDDFARHKEDGEIGDSYQKMIQSVMVFPNSIRIRNRYRLTEEEFGDLVRDVAFDSWRYMASRDYSGPLHLYHSMTTVILQRLINRIPKKKRIRTFGTHQDLVELGFEDSDDGGMELATMLLDLQFKLKNDLGDYRSSLVYECLISERWTIREIQEYAGISNHQARQLKQIITDLVEDYCGIS